MRQAAKNGASPTTKPPTTHCKCPRASPTLSPTTTPYSIAHGYNWGIANNPTRPHPQPDTSQVGLYTVSLPTAVAKGCGRGFEDHGVKEFFDELED